MTESHLRTKELANRWRMQEQTLRLWRHLGKGPRFFCASSRLVLYPLREVEAYEQSRTFRSTSAVSEGLSDGGSSR